MATSTFSGANSFTTFAVSGQSDIVADSTADTLTVAAGSNITLTTDAATDTLTIAASGGGSITGADTRVLFFDGANTPAGEAGLTYTKTTHTLKVAGSGASDPFLRVNNTVATKGLAVFVNDSGGVQFVADDNDFTNFFVMNPAADITFSPATVLAITNQMGASIWSFNPNSGPVVDSAADLRFGNGFGIKADTTTAHTVLFRAYDVDGAGYATFATLTNGNTPDFTIAPPAGGTVTLQATTFKSSDGSSGATGSGTVISAITVKDGLITAITVA